MSVNADKKKTDSLNEVSSGDPLTEVSCWSWCVMGVKYVQAYWKQKTQPESVRKKEMILKEEHDIIYLLSEYEYNNHTYKIPIKIERNKLMRFVKAYTVNDRGEDEVCITDIIRDWLGPNEDFHQTAVTPNLLGYVSIRLYSLDLETFDTIDRIFTTFEVLTLEASIPELEDTLESDTIDETPFKDNPFDVNLIIDDDQCISPTGNDQDSPSSFEMVTIRDTTNEELEIQTSDLHPDLQTTLQSQIQLIEETIRRQSTSDRLEKIALEPRPSTSIIHIETSGEGLQIHREELKSRHVN